MHLSISVEFEISSVSHMSPSSSSQGTEYCEVATGVRIPCQVLEEQGSRAAYRIAMPEAGEAVARSHCDYNSSA